MQSSARLQSTAHNPRTHHSAHLRQDVPSKRNYAAQSQAALAVEPPLARRAMMALLAAGGISITLVGSPAAAAATAPYSPSFPNPQTFTSSEGFQFDYPGTTWVVAFDRSGGRGSGAVVSVGDFTRFLVISVFRTVEVPDSVRKLGLDEASGRALCLDTQAAAETTQGFTQVKSEMGSAGQYNFEYEIEVCRGEVQEGKGGVLRCMGPAGQVIPTQKRHHLGRAILGKGGLLTIMASTTVDQWDKSASVMQAIVDSFRAV